MTFFMTNNSGLLSRRGTRNVFSEWTYTAPVSVDCAVVKLVDKVSKTSVRTDQSGSRGNAEEETTVANILFPPEVGIRLDDQFLIDGIKMRVIGVQPRHDIIGDHDHDEVTLEHLT